MNKEKESNIEVVRTTEKNIVTEKEIVDYLDSIGMKHALKGFRYIVEAVAGMLSGEYKTGTCIMYASIAEKFNTTGQRVERAIRHSLDAIKIEKTNNSEFLHKTADMFRYR